MSSCGPETEAASSQAEAPPSLAIDALPDDLLRRVMAAAGQQHRGSLVRVSKRWRRCCDSEPALWNPYALPCSTADHLWRADGLQRWREANGSVLLRVGHLVTSLHVGSCDFWWHGPEERLALAAAAVECLAQLQPGVLSALKLLWGAHEPPPAAVLEALPRLAAGLTRLQLRTRMPPEAAEAFAQLTALRSLELLQYHPGDSQGGPDQRLPAAVVAALASLARLETLSICFELGGGAAFPHLPRLASLVCSAHAAGPALLDGIASLESLTHLELALLGQAPPDLGMLTRLQRLRNLELTAPDPGGGQGDGGGAPAEPSCWPPPSAFPRLRAFCLQSGAAHGFWMPDADCALRSCEFNWSDKCADHPYEQCGFLALRAPTGGQPAAHGCPAQELMDALTGALLRTVDCVLYSGPAALVRPLAGCSQLRRVCSLRLQAAGAIALDGLTLPALTSLALGKCYSSTSLSLAAARLPALQRLRYSGTAGTLSISGCTLPQLTQLETEPPTAYSSPACDSITIAASALPALQQLSLSAKRLHLPGARLPALSSLQLTACERLARDAHGQLDIADAELPALQRLSVTGCSAVRLTALPSLHTLELRSLVSGFTIEPADAALPALETVLLRGKPWFAEGAPPETAMTWLAALAMLKSASLESFHLPEDLPHGPWLAGLERLDIRGGKLRRLPPTLRAATRLTALCCSTGDFQLQPDDVDSILLQLPSLRELDLPWLSCCTPSTFLHVFTTLRHLAVPERWPGR